MRHHLFAMSILNTIRIILLFLIVSIATDVNANNLGDGSYKEVAHNGVKEIYTLDEAHTLVKSIPVPKLNRPRGIAVDARSNRIYLPHRGKAGRENKIRRFLGFQTFGYVMSVDLLSGETIWNKRFYPSIDSLAVTPKGDYLYMPSGEEIEDHGFWVVLDASTGKEVDRIPFVKGAHNTIINKSGETAYLASLMHNYLGVVDTSTNIISRTIGPFGENIRPFAISNDESFAFVTVNFLSGFEVADLNTGKVLHRVEVEGWSWEDPPLPLHQSHGISLIPDESEVWVVDAYNKHIHIYDVTELPNFKPIYIASIDVKDDADLLNLPKWINSSRNGKYMHVSTGHIIDTNKREIVAQVRPSRYFVEIEILNGKIHKAYTRYGVGYAD